MFGTIISGLLILCSSTTKVHYIGIKYTYSAQKAAYNALYILRSILIAQYYSESMYVLTISTYTYNYIYKNN